MAGTPSGPLMNTGLAARRRVLWIIPLVYFVFVSAEFAAFTELALRATQEGRRALEVGVLASCLWLGILVSSARAHAVVERVGHARVFVGANLLAALAMATLPWHGVFWAWCAAMGVLGLAGGLVWVTGEAWLAELAPPERRGFFVGLFETAVGLGLMAGPALVTLAAHLQWPLLVMAAGLMVLAWVASLRLMVAAAPVTASADVDSDDLATEPAVPAPHPPGLPGQGVVPSPPSVAWPLVLVASLSGLMESGVSSMLPSLSMRMGFSLEHAAWLGTVIGAGSALLQPPAGHLADRLGTRRIALGAWLVVMLANAVLLLVGGRHSEVLWGVGFVLGGVGGAVYTLLIIDLGHRLQGVLLVKAIAGLVVAYSAGTSLGPLVGGALFDASGIQGLALAFVLLSGLGILATAKGLVRAPERARRAA